MNNLPLGRERNNLSKNVSSSSLSETSLHITLCRKCDRFKFFQRKFIESCSILISRKSNSIKILNINLYDTVLTVNIVGFLKEEAVSTIIYKC